VINLEPNYIQNLQKFDDESIEVAPKPYKSAIGISTPTEENGTLLFNYFRFDVNLKTLDQEQLKTGNNLIKPTSSQYIHLPTAIKGFLGGQMHGSII